MRMQAESEFSDVENLYIIMYINLLAATLSG